MKRLLKIIIPILLVVLLLAGALLFLLVFRPDITQEFFMNRADAALAEGNYSSAVTNYRRAGIVSSDNPELALKLAQAYEGSGNFTKAEYTWLPPSLPIPKNWTCIWPCPGSMLPRTSCWTPIRC